MDDAASLQALEQALLKLAGGRPYLYLEEVDETLQAELAYLAEGAFAATAPSAPPSRSRVEPAALKPSPFAEIAPKSVEIKLPEVIPPKLEPPRHDLHQPPTKDPLSALNLDSLHYRAKDCQNCNLSLERRNFVFGEGNPKARLVFVGEAPGEEEDLRGRPFVGRAGQLLTQMILAMGVNRQWVYILNVIKCRPPGNRNPHQEELKACEPLWKKQLELLEPDVIVTLGNVATKALVSNAEGITKMRGQWVEYQGIPLIPTYHPSYLLRNPAALPEAWGDLRKIRARLFAKRRG